MSRAWHTARVRPTWPPPSTVRLIVEAGADVDPVREGLTVALAFHAALLVLRGRLPPREAQRWTEGALRALPRAVAGHPVDAEVGRLIARALRHAGVRVLEG